MVACFSLALAAQVLAAQIGVPEAKPQASKAPVTTAWDPWEEQHSGISEPLRGIHAVGNGVAWASGAHGTILRTEDSGFVWQRCPTPRGAEALDFRSIWAWDAQTAVVMSSGPGKQSRVYKTTDGGSHWKLLFTNTQDDGFFDALAFSDDKNGYILGDPTNGRLVVLRTEDGGQKWVMVPSKQLDTDGLKLGAFAASNQAMVLLGPVLGPVYVPWFGTSGASGTTGAFVYTGGLDCAGSTGGAGVAHTNLRSCLNRDWSFEKHQVPMAGGSQTAGIFALGLRSDGHQDGQPGGAVHAVAVGGDYTNPGASEGTAAYRDAKTGNWMAAAHLPHGYRSSVAWDAEDNAWIAVGPNGSDVSYDDGQTWRPIGNDGYNAISLPWVVGPDGHIAKLKSLKGK
jgi:hypothetical protein